MAKKRGYFANDDNEGKWVRVTNYESNFSNFEVPPVTFSVTSQNIPLSVLFSHTLKFLSSSLKVTDKVTL
jgi:hypothetical protein